MCMGRKCLSLFMIPIVRDNLFAVFSIYCFHCRCSSIVSPRKLKIVRLLYYSAVYFKVYVVYYSISFIEYHIFGFAGI